MRRQLETVALIVVLAILFSRGVQGQTVGPNFTVAVPPCGFEHEPSVVVQGTHLLTAWGGIGCGFPRAAASDNGGASWQDVSGIPWEGIRDQSAPIAICAGDSGRFYLVAPTFILGPGYRAIEVYEGKFVGATFYWRRLINAVPRPYGAWDHPKAMSLKFDPVTRNLYLAFTKVQFAGASGSTTLTHDTEYRITFVRSTDGGASWDPALDLTGPESNGPKLVVGPLGELDVIWENYALGKLMRRHSSDFGASFGPEIEVTPIHEPVMTPTSWRGYHNHRRPPQVAGLFSISPPGFAMAVDRSTGPRRGTWYLVTAEHATGTVGPMTGERREVEPNNIRTSATPIGIGEDVTGLVVFSETGGSDDDFLTFTGEAGQSIWLNVSSSPADEPFGVSLSCESDQGGSPPLAPSKHKPRPRSTPCLPQVATTLQHSWHFRGAPLTIGSNCASSRSTRARWRETTGISC